MGSYLEIAYTLTLFSLSTTVIIASPSPAEYNTTRTYAYGRMVTCVNGQPCPFNDLGADEISVVQELIRRDGTFDRDIHLAIVRQQEPAKRDWLAGGDYVMNERLVYVALFDTTKNVITEVLIDLRARRIIQREQLPKGIYPPVLDQEEIQAEELIRASSQWKAAVRKRGVDPKDTTLDLWTPGPAVTTQHPDKRLIRAITHYNNPQSQFSYWNTLEGIHITVDLIKGSVFDFYDFGLFPVPPPVVQLPTDPNPQLKPIHVTQSEGTSIKVQGQLVEWYKWKFQYSMDSIVGLQFYHIRYHADCHDRMVIYKLSLAEMFVPYGAPGQGWTWRRAFDVGEYGRGRTAQPLTAGVDVPENAIFFNCTFPPQTLEEPPVLTKDCIAAYEVPTGLLYKHTNADTGETNAKAGRELWFTFLNSVGNYDYKFNFVFQMDGTIRVMPELTGILLSRGVNLRQQESSNQLNCRFNCEDQISEYLIAPTHQHFFNYRIDLDIDGANNHVVQVDIESDSAQGETVFTPRKHVVPEETSRDYNIKTARTWRVLNLHSKNTVGSGRGYTLKPGVITVPFGAPRKYAKFVSHPIWFTRYNDRQQTAAAKFPRSSPAGQGVSDYISNKESLLDKDVVLWYTFGITHIPKLEEWPIMTQHRTFFELSPTNFLSFNADMNLESKCFLPYFPPDFCML